jgi:hypothetical protein
LIQKTNTATSYKLNFTKGLLPIAYEALFLNYVLLKTLKESRMKNFTFKMLSLLFLGFIGLTAYAQEWNFSSASFNALGSVTATTTVSGLTIYASAIATVDVDANAKSLDGMTFTNRMKLGGTGAFDADGKPATRVLTFPVTGNTKITVMGMSSSSTADRELIIAAGTKETIVGKFPALGASISKGEYTYTGAATTIYIYSSASGVNLYYLKAANLTTGMNVPGIQEYRVYPNPASEKVFINVAEPTEIGIYSLTGQLMKQQLVASAQNYINVSDLNSGVYFVKTMKTENMTQKLIIR